MAYSSDDVWSSFDPFLVQDDGAVNRATEARQTRPTLAESRLTPSADATREVGRGCGREELP